MCYSSDGYALAAAWVYGGISVWSPNGTLLTSTVTEDTFIHSSDGVLQNTTEAFFKGTSDLFWAPYDYFLFMLPCSAFNPKQKTEIDNEPMQDIFAQHFAKSSLLASHTWNNGRHLCLVCSDRLMLYTGLTNISDTNTLYNNALVDSSLWLVVHIPILYLSENWPIKVIFN